MSARKGIQSLDSFISSPLFYVTIAIAVLLIVGVVRHTMTQTAAPAPPADPTTPVAEKAVTDPAGIQAQRTLDDLRRQKTPTEYVEQLRQEAELKRRNELPTVQAMPSEPPQHVVNEQN